MWLLFVAIAWADCSATCEACLIGDDVPLDGALAIRLYSLSEPTTHIVDRTTGRDVPAYSRRYQPDVLLVTPDEPWTPGHDYAVTIDVCEFHDDSGYGFTLPFTVSAASAVRPSGTTLVRASRRCQPAGEDSTADPIEAGVEWTGDAADLYEIQVATAPDFVAAEREISTMSDQIVVPYVCYGGFEADPATTYYLRGRALDVAGQGSVWSDTVVVPALGDCSHDSGDTAANAAPECACQDPGHATGFSGYRAGLWVFGLGGLWYRRRAGGRA